MTGMSDPTSFPLTWPTGRPRKHPGRRRRGKFSRDGSPITVAGALGRLQGELERYAARWPVISTNIALRRDGLPYSGQKEPDDPGVAVYFHRDGKPYTLACDTFDRVADNLAAVSAHIEATRAIERHGVATAEEMLLRAAPDLLDALSYAAAENVLPGYVLDVAAAAIAKARGDNI